jgi:hypothetical protein
MFHVLRWRFLRLFRSENCRYVRDTRLDCSPEKKGAGEASSVSTYNGVPTVTFGPEGAFFKYPSTQLIRTPRAVGSAFPDGWLSAQPHERLSASPFKGANKACFENILELAWRETGANLQSGFFALLAILPYLAFT